MLTLNFQLWELPSISLLFILGFFLGDGNFNYRLRTNEKISLPWYIAQLRISQKYTEDKLKSYRLAQGLGFANVMVLNLELN